MAEFVMRKHQRLKRLVPVRYRGDGIVGEGIIQDLSLSGSYLTGNAPVSVGIALALELLAPGNSEPLLIDRVTVKWVEGSECWSRDNTTQYMSEKRRGLAYVPERGRRYQWRPNARKAETSAQGSGLANK